MHGSLARTSIMYDTTQLSVLNSLEIGRLLMMNIYFYNLQFFYNEIVQKIIISYFLW
jgi:hypothetical protein